jgi:hypothetical protein
VLTLAALAGVCALGGSSRGYQRLGLPVLSMVVQAAQGEDLNGARTPDRPEGNGRAAEPTIPAPSVAVLSIEPTTPAAPGVDAEVPVVFPGYVLPDDSLEVPAHEGS